MHVSRNAVYLIALACLLLSTPLQAQPAGVADEEQALREKLRKVDSFEFQEASLPDALDYLGKRAQIDIELDPFAVSQDKLRAPLVTLTATQVPLENALQRMLAPLKLDYFLRDSTVVITSIEMAEAHVEIRVYDVSDLMGEDLNEESIRQKHEELVEMISTTVHPVTWDEVGGDGSMTPISIRGVQALVIAQRREVHREIVELFATLRQTIETSPAVDRKLSRTKVSASKAESLSGLMLVGMGEKESLLIDYESFGCFHHVHYEFRFSGEDRSQVTITKLKSYDKDPARRELGNLQLGREDLHGMNRLLNYYRAEPQGNCSTSETVTFQWLRQGEQFASETYTDTSCKLLMADGFSLTELILRVQPVVPEAADSKQSKQNQ